MLCIYCKKDKKIEKFDREHVVPELFGRFKENLVLHNLVCHCCNSFFGNNLELTVGRDSYEGLLRYSLGITNFKKTKRARITIKCWADGEFKDALMGLTDYDAENDIWHVEFLPQVAFRDSNGEKKFFIRGNIPDKTTLENQSINTNVMWVYGQAEDLEGLIAEIKSKGINFIQKNIQTTPQEFNANIPKKVAIRAKFDDLNLRLIAKIAFNYLAYLESPEFLLNDSFDLVRNYIRYGYSYPSKYIEIQKRPLLYEEIENIKITNGHIVTLQWRGGPIVAKIRLFNQVTYSVVLCENFNGIFRNIQSGHHFDHVSKEITELHCISHIYIPQL